MSTAFEFTWLNDREAVAGGVPVEFVSSDFQKHHTTAERIVVLKPKSYFDRYAALIPEPKSVLELGVFQGGSAIALAAQWRNTKIVGVDICNRLDAAEAHFERLGISERVRFHYKTSQDDVAKLQGIIAEDLSGQVDVVIDDASHMYALSRRSFEIVFPYVKPGGYYVLEDWGWAHWKDAQGEHQFSDSAALSNLVFEFVMLSASAPNLIESVHVTPGFTLVKRGVNKLKFTSPLSLDEIYFARGKKLQHI